MPKVVYEGEVTEHDIKSEDGGCALIWEAGPDQVTPPDENPDAGMFVRLQSWDENKNHDTLRKMVGRKVKITVEYSSPIEELAAISWMN